MFSMSGAQVHSNLDALLERFGSVLRRGVSETADGLVDDPRVGLREDSRAIPQKANGLPTGLSMLDDWLADGGLPRGVSVLSSPQSVGGACELAVRVLAQLHASRPCLAAWVDPSRSLFAPGLLLRGVDLARLVVVRPSAEAPEHRAMAAMELVVSGAFAAVVVDLDDPWGSSPQHAQKPHAQKPHAQKPHAQAPDAQKPHAQNPHAQNPHTQTPHAQEPAAQKPAEDLRSEMATLRRDLAQEERFLRRLTDASKKAGTAVLLLANSSRRRSAPLAAALRLTCTMPEINTLCLAVDHDRRGTPRAPITVPLTPGRTQGESLRSAVS